MDLVQLLTCPSDLVPIFRFLKFGIFPIIQIGIPIILIVMGSIDLGKAVLSSDDKEIKGATGKLIKRAIAAVAVFFITTVVSLLMNMFTNSGATDSDNVDGTNSWKDCWSTLTR
ncbi:MAG: hypothetical protein K2I72_02430 [Bacilli bacterium]|nr:hypothetical protein [Bacilli bacterium]